MNQLSCVFLWKSHLPFYCAKNHGTSSFDWWQFWDGVAEIISLFPLAGILEQSAVWVDEFNYYDMRTDRNKGLSPLSLRPNNPLGIEIDKYGPYDPIVHKRTTVKRKIIFHQALRFGPTRYAARSRCKRGQMIWHTEGVAANLLLETQRPVFGGPGSFCVMILISKVRNQKSRWKKKNTMDQEHQKCQDFFFLDLTVQASLCVCVWTHGGEGGGALVVM